MGFFRWQIFVKMFSSIKIRKLHGPLQSPQVLYYKPSQHSALEAALIGGPPELGKYKQAHPSPLIL